MELYQLLQDQHKCKDGSAKDSLFKCPSGITISSEGTLYVVDMGNNQIRNISTYGVVTTVAGSTEGFKDGNSNDSLFNTPYGITISSDGTLFVTDCGNDRIRKISANK